MHLTLWDYLSRWSYFLHRDDILHVCEWRPLWHQPFIRYMVVVSWHKSIEIGCMLFMCIVKVVIIMHLRQLNLWVSKIIEFIYRYNTYVVCNLPPWLFCIVSQITSPKEYTSAFMKLSICLLFIVKSKFSGAKYLLVPAFINTSNKCRKSKKYFE